MTGTLVSGRPVDEVDDAHRRVLDAGRAYGASLRRVRVLFRCHLQPQLDGLAHAVLREHRARRIGIVYFLHCVVAYFGHGVATSLGRTCLETENGRKVLSARPLELTVV